MKNLFFTGLFIAASCFIQAQTAIIDATVDGSKVILTLYQSEQKPTPLGEYNYKDRDKIYDIIIRNIDILKLNGYSLTTATPTQYILEKKK